MSSRGLSLFLMALGLSPFILLSAQQPGQEPTCEQVFKEIKVFKGVPASDLIPAMEFMSASLKYECTDCHVASDFAADTKTKEAARSMVLMQRDINTKNFNGRLEVTCFTCHGGKEHPASVPLPEGISLRHERSSGGPTPESLIAAQTAASGKLTGILVRTGTMTAPNDATHKPETKPVEFVQADGSKFYIESGDRKIKSDGKHTFYGPNEMFGEPAAIFGRIGRSWREPDVFTGLSNLVSTGTDKIGKSTVDVVRGKRASTSSTEELMFDQKTHLLMRLVNMRPSSIGMVVSSIDYTNFKLVGGANVPMKVVFTYPNGAKWVMDFKSAKVVDKVDSKLFTTP